MWAPWPRPDLPIHVFYVIVGKDNKRQKDPRMFGPFKSWNRSWDGWAAEDHVLGNPGEHRRLSHRLARKAAARTTTKREWKDCWLPDVKSVIKSLPIEGNDNSDENSISTSSGTAVKKRMKQCMRKVTLKK